METMGMMTAERTAENAITERGVVGAGLPPRARHARGGVQRVTAPAGDGVARGEVATTAPTGDGAARGEVHATAPTTDEAERGEDATTAPTTTPTTTPTPAFTTTPTAEGEGETRAESARGIKRWILLLMRMGELPERLCDKIDERIERLALDPFGQTKKQYEKILSLTDVKGRIINLKLMRELLVGGLDPAQTFLLTRYAMGYSAAQLAADLDIKESTMYKRVRTAIGRAAAMLERAGFSESRLDDEYASMPAIKGIMKVFRRQPLLLFR